MSENWLTRRQVAELIGCSTKVVDKAIRNGELVAVRVGHLVRITPEALKDFERRSRCGVCA